MRVRLQVVATVYDVLEAELITRRLRDAHIPAAFHAAPSALQDAADEPIPILVPAGKRERARLVLAGVEEEGIVAVGPAPEPLPPSPGRTSIALWAGALAVVTAAVLALLI
jgi:hypothetical protein